ncbi:MAG: hypothetical protein ACSW8H_00885 [bacterium]
MQNVDRFFFEKNAPLKNEYERLFSSVFSNSDMMKALVELLNTKNSGYTRTEISERSGYRKYICSIFCFIAKSFILWSWPQNSGPQPDSECSARV